MLYLLLEGVGSRGAEAIPIVSACWNGVNRVARASALLDRGRETRAA
jgi:hypothetical protein